MPFALLFFRATTNRPQSMAQRSSYDSSRYYFIDHFRQTSIRKLFFMSFPHTYTTQTIPIPFPFILLILQSFLMEPCETAGLVHNALGVCVASTGEDGNLIWQIIGCLLMGTIAGLSSLAGLGGGGPNVVIMIVFFDMLPKDATIAVFASIMGSSFGNMFNQMRTAFNNQPMIRYQYAFVTLPLMFLGALVGVLLNRWLPSIILAAIIISVTFYSFPKILSRFKDAHAKQTEEKLIHEENGRVSGILKQTRINPFDDDINVKIFKQLALLVGVYFLLSLLRGSEKIPSLIGISNCSVPYWLLQIAIFVMAAWFYRYNKRSLDFWTAPTLTLGQQLFDRVDFLEQNKEELISKGFGAGIFSGFGLGGGIYLVPLFRNLGLNPLQATATCTFTIFVAASINCLQAMLLGVLSLSAFLFYFGISAGGSYFLSVWISTVLRRAHRLSYVELLLLILLSAAIIFYPYSLWLKYLESGRDTEVVFGFGSVC